MQISNDQPKPKTWTEKNYGQICRNFTINRHIQCPEGSFIHWYVCCGADNTECCFGIQSWALVVFGCLSIVGLLILAHFLLLHFNIICAKEEDSISLTLEKVVES
uniref:Uncharacterized protein n=1 Tax=Acrobeloides nanus TaxID=290746 RepID=A0A914CC49_9BILA